MSAAESSRTTAPALSLVCPVYDEADNIERTLDTIATSVTIPFELLVVYDRDEDTTVPVVRRAARRHAFPIRLVRNAYGRGAANAIRTGFEHATGEAVLVIMADLADDFSVVDRMYRVLTEDGYDLVCGSRYMPGGRQVGGPRFKGFLSRMAGLSLRWVLSFPTHDATNSFKMYRLEFLRQTPVESTGGFEIGIEMLAKAWVSGRRITEVPSVWTDRVAGQSRFRLWTWLPRYLRWYFHAFRRLKPNPAKRDRG